MTRHFLPESKFVYWAVVLRTWPKAKSKHPPTNRSFFPLLRGSIGLLNKIYPWDDGFINGDWPFHSILQSVQPPHLTTGYEYIKRFSYWELSFLSRPSVCLSWSQSCFFHNIIWQVTRFASDEWCEVGRKHCRQGCKLESEVAPSIIPAKVATKAWPESFSYD